MEQESTQERKSSRVYRVCGTFFAEGAVLVLVFGIFENYWRNTLTQTLAIEAAVVCVAFLAVGVVFELMR